MIIKTNLGGGFKGLVSYLTEEKVEDRTNDIKINERGKILLIHNLTPDKGMMIREMIAHASKYNDSRSNGKYVWHTKISFDHTDKVNDRILTLIAKEYADQNGLNNSQHFVIRHDETKHAQIHIMANRVMTNNKLLNHANINIRDFELARKLEEQYGLRIVGVGKNLDKIRLQNFGNKADRQKIEINKGLIDAVKFCDNRDELKTVLARMNIDMGISENGEEYLFTKTNPVIRNEKLYTYRGRSIDMQMFTKLEIDSSLKACASIYYGQNEKKQLLQNIAISKYNSRSFAEFKNSLQEANIKVVDIGKEFLYLTENNDAVNFKYTEQDIDLTVSKQEVEKRLEQNWLLFEALNKQNIIEKQKLQKKENESVQRGSHINSKQLNKETVKEIALEAKQTAKNLNQFKLLLKNHGIEVFERGKEISYRYRNDNGKDIHHRGSSLDERLLKDSLVEAFDANFNKSKQNFQCSKRKCKDLVRSEIYETLHEAENKNGYLSLEQIKEVLTEKSIELKLVVDVKGKIVGSFYLKTLSDGRKITIKSNSIGKELSFKNLIIQHQLFKLRKEQAEDNIRSGRSNVIIHELTKDLVRYAEDESKMMDNLAIILTLAIFTHVPSKHKKIFKNPFDNVEELAKKRELLKREIAQKLKDALKICKSIDDLQASLLKNDIQMTVLARENKIIFQKEEVIFLSADIQQNLDKNNIELNILKNAKNNLFENSSISTNPDIDELVQPEREEKKPRFKI